MNEVELENWLLNYLEQSNGWSSVNMAVMEYVRNNGQEYKSDGTNLIQTKIRDTVERLVTAGVVETQYPGSVQGNAFRMISSDTVAEQDDGKFGSGSYGTGPYGNSIEQRKPYNGVIARGIGEPSIKYVSAEATDSAKWTGAQFVLVDAAVIANIKAKADELQQAVYALHLASNSETEDLQKLADALVLVCSMTEPEASIIDRITSSPKFKAYAGLVVIIATIRGALGI